MLTRASLAAARRYLGSRLLRNVAVRCKKTFKNHVIKIFWIIRLTCMPRHNTITNSQKALFQKLFVAESDSLDEVLMSILSEINCCSPQLRYATILSKTRPSKNYKYDEYKLCNKLKHMHQQVSICKSIYLNSDNSRGIYFRIRSYCFDFFT